VRLLHGSSCGTLATTQYKLDSPVCDGCFGVDGQADELFTEDMAEMAPISEKRGWFASVREFCGSVSFSRRKVATGAAAILALGVGYHVIFGANGLTVYEQKRQETHALTTQLQDLQRENELLKSHVGRLESDPNAIEHQAREELHYTRPGEVIYALPSSPPSDANAVSEASSKH
jgi:cell division protein FtsB